jgi:hypothetical protein
LSDLPIKIPNSTLHDIASSFLSPDVSPDSIIELVVTVEDTNINVREFAAYLSLMDGIYGRASRGDFRSYSFNQYVQLEISEIRKGSIDLVSTEILSHFRDTFPILILYFFLKYFPIGLKTISEATKNFTESYKSLEEARIVRENRKKLKAEMKRDEVLQNLDRKQINQLSALLASLEMTEQRKLPAALRFSRKFVRSVTIRIRRR